MVVGVRGRSRGSPTHPGTPTLKTKRFRALGLVDESCRDPSKKAADATTTNRGHTCQIQLHLEADVHVGTVDGRRPPQREAAVGDLVQPRPLGVGQLLVLHALLEPGGLLPEQPLPRREVRPLEEGVLQDALDTWGGGRGQRRAEEKNQFILE